SAAQADSPREQDDTGQTAGEEPSADRAASQAHQEAPTYAFPAEHLDPSCCPGCKAVVPKEYSILPRVRCLSCGRWELYTGLLVGPVAAPPGPPPVVLRVAAPFWQLLLPDRLPSGDGMGREEERPQQVAGEGISCDQGVTEQGEGGGESAEETLKPSREKAYRLFQWAMEQNPSLKTDKEVYDWLLERSDLPEELPNFGSWSKYLRDARAYYSDHKHTPRTTNKVSGKSVVRRDQI